MRSFIGLFAICCVFLLASAAPKSDEKTGPDHGKVVLCRITEEDFDNGYEFVLLRADFNLCTHLVLTEDKKMLLKDEPKEDKPKEDTDQQKIIKEIQRKFPHLKIHKEQDFVEFVSKYITPIKDDEQQKKTVEAVTKTVKDALFNGWNLYGGDLGTLVKKYNEKEWEKFSKFMKELKSSFKDNSLALVMSTSVTKKYLSAEKPVFPDTEAFDLIVLLPEYLIDDAARKPEDALKDMSIELEKEKVELFMNKTEMSKSKLLMGLYFGGESYRTRDTKRVLFNEICRLQNDKSYNKDYDKKSSVAMLDNKRDEKIVYLNSRSIANRVRFAINNELAGAMTDYIVGDDFKGKCELETDVYEDFKDKEKEIKLPKTRDNARFPLLNTVNEAIVVALQENGANAITTNIFFAVALAMAAFLMH